LAAYRHARYDPAAQRALIEETGAPPTAYLNDVRAAAGWPNLPRHPAPGRIFPVGAWPEADAEVFCTVGPATHTCRLDLLADTAVMPSESIEATLGEVETLVGAKESTCAPGTGRNAAPSSTPSGRTRARPACETERRYGFDRRHGGHDLGPPGGVAGQGARRGGRDRPRRPGDLPRAAAAGRGSRRCAARARGRPRDAGRVVPGTDHRDARGGARRVGRGRRVRAAGSGVPGRTAADDARGRGHRPGADPGGRRSGAAGRRSR